MLRIRDIGDASLGGSSDINNFEIRIVLVLFDKFDGLLGIDTHILNMYREIKL